MTTLWVVVPLLLFATEAFGAELPDGFAVAPVVTGLTAPIALAVAPDGRWFVAERGGRIVIVQDGVVQEPAFAEIAVFTGGECGLLGLALDPNFVSNGWVYAFASVSDTEQQILRLHEVNGVSSATEVVFGDLPTRGSNHNGGALKFGADGKLYFAIGENGERPNSQDLSTLAGKVSRINADGTVPADNPFVATAGAADPIWALGFRNPFRMCFASDGRLFVDDVGSSGEARREEVNLVARGGNYGWPVVEGIAGPGDPDGYLDPIVAYAADGSTIAGCAVYEATQFPAAYWGDLFFVDYNSGGVFRVQLNQPSAEQELFYQAGDGPIDVAIDLDGSLLVAEIIGGRILRFSYTADGPPDGTPPPDSTPPPNSTPPPDEEPPASDGSCGAGLWTMLAGALGLASAGLLRRRAQVRS